MAFIWFLLIIILGIIIHVFLPNKQMIILPFMFLSLLLIMGLVVDIADYSNYKAFYYGSQYVDFFDFDVAAAQYYNVKSDIGYMLLNRLSYDYGLDYSYFRFVSTLVFLLLMTYIVYKITNNIALVIVLYMIYPFTLDAIQVRNFMAEILLALSIYLWAKRVKCHNAVYILLMLIASTLHKSFIIYVPFALFFYMRECKKINVLYKVFLLIGLLMPLYESIIISRFADILLLIQNAPEEYSSTAAYYLDGRTRLGFLVAYTKIVIMLFIAWYIKENIVIEMNGLKERFVKITYIFMEYMCILMPLIGITAAMWRFPRNLLLPLAITIAIYFEYNFKYKGIKTLLVCLAFFAIAVLDDCTYSLISEVLNNNYMWILFER